MPQAVYLEQVQWTLKAGAYEHECFAVKDELTNASTEKLFARLLAVAR